MMGASDLHLRWSVYYNTPSSASGSRARDARDKRYWSVWVLAQFPQVGSALAIPSSILSFWLTVWRIGRRAPLLNGALKFAWLIEMGALKFAWLIEMGALTWEGRAQVCLIDRSERAHLRGALKFAWLIEVSAPLLIRARSRKMALRHYWNTWFSIQYPDGVVQVVSTKGVAVSITGCRLGNGASQIFFYRQPRRQASTKCPLPALKQLNFWMQIPSQLSRFMNWSIDHFVISTSFWPSLISLDGHIEAMRMHQRIPCSKGVEGYVGPFVLGVGEEGGVSCWGR